ncbi:hypothetical protein BASA60_005340 [Batrachochytrium salamandrivorans]|nr:hypothetical protein BASA60_005340 [Batrachochytrium salamandrivorans]
MDMAIRIDNRLFERRQEQRLFHQRPFFQLFSATPTISRFRNQQQQQRFLSQNKLQYQINTALLSIHPPLGPLQNQVMTWTSIYSKGPTISNGTRKSDETRTLPCLWGSWSSKANCPKSRFNSDALRNIRAIQTDEINGETLGNDTAAFK